MQTGSRHARHGYTLTELMVTVTIVGILASIAIPMYTSYHRKTKTSEATSFLARVKGAQETFRSEDQLQQYCEVSPSQASWNPRATPNAQPAPWNPNQDEWDKLGVGPGGEVVFSYSSVAGPAGTSPSAFGFDDDRGYTGRHPWFISSAIGDLDGDGVFVTFESYSESAGVYISEANGWE